MAIAFVSGQQKQQQQQLAMANSHLDMMDRCR